LWLVDVTGFWGAAVIDELFLFDENDFFLFLAIKPDFVFLAINPDFVFLTVTVLSSSPFGAGVDLHRVLSIASELVHL
jgi:hypothetical protein